MKKIFEDYFTEFQADMVSICLEYVEDRADKIYIYCAYEANSIYGDFFYMISGKIVERDQLNSNLGSTDLLYDTSDDRQLAVLRILTEDMEKIAKLCTEYERSVPTEMKLMYDVKSNALEANYNYENVITGTEFISEHIFDKWFQEVKANKNNS